jgi:LPS-assembly lipoprotein
MSSFSRACRTALIAVALIAPLAACSGLRPVYQYGEADAERMAVRFGSPSSRIEQVIYNELKLRFLKGGDDAPLVTVSASASGRALTANTITTPASQQEAIVAATVTITDADGEVVGSATRTATADYTTSPQAFANQEIAADAQRRAAKLVADSLRLDIYSALNK